LYSAVRPRLAFYFRMTLAANATLALKLPTWLRLVLFVMLSLV
jgi:hypothetical protein